ncbi:MAG: SDR family oxidoreductase [Acidobacteria bacterium]|nr:SDR family oxidoreductase [Acidobacteriota bacterium]
MNPDEMNEPLEQQTPKCASSAVCTYWRVEGSLLNLSAVRPVAFFTWNAQSFSERWARRGGLGLLALVRPLLYAANRVFATRVLHTLLCGISQDRLDLLGEEYFQYVLKPWLRPAGVKKLKEWMAAGGQVILVSQGLDHVMRPLANFLGVERLLANRLEFRDGLATGRMLEPVIPPRGALARLRRRSSDGRISSYQLAKDIGPGGRPEIVNAAIIPARRQFPRRIRPVVLFDSRKTIERLSVRESLAGKHILLIGVTGFIGKVWLVHLLSDLPEVGKIYLLIRRQGPNTALRRFEKIVEESPVFDGFHQRYGEDLVRFLSERIEVVEGDVSQPGLGIEAQTRARLCRTLDVVVNSSGLTDFNPDLRDALAANVDAVMHLLDFLRQCDHAGLMHLSTCYVVGSRDGRVAERLQPDYTPASVEKFNAEIEWQHLHDLVRQIEERSKSPAVTKELRRLVLKKGSGGENLSATALENQIRRQRIRWIRKHSTKAATRRAQHLGWPNTYTLTKSLAESLIQKRGGELPVVIVRPSIVETSTRQPFQGWNEGINTSAPLSYLLGTYFRQLPTNERKCLDVIPVDMVCRGMTLIAAALVRRCHAGFYQLATSASNPCDMRRSIELTCLAHRKHYRAQEDFKHWFRSLFDTIPVSKGRYQKFSAPAQKAVIRAIMRTTPPLSFIRPPLERTERNLVRVEKLIELYEPFILLNEHVFEAGNVELLSDALVPEEKDTFGYDATSIDWWEYWINIHIPAQRKWSYPLIEGRPLEPRPPRTFHLSASSHLSGAGSGASGPDGEAERPLAAC